MLQVTLHHRQGDLTLAMDFTSTARVTALFGPSGSGKSSVLMMIAGHRQPQHGRIQIAETVLFDSDQKINLPPEQRHLGIVFQEGRLFPHLSVRDNLLFGYRRRLADQRHVSFDPVVAVLGIGPLLDRRPATLSGGEKQRVAIGRALLQSPRLLLMDEPLAALDTQRKAEVLPFIATLSKEFKLPILYVSHAMDEVIQLADHLILVERGQIAASGMVDTLLARPDLAPLTGAGHAGAVLIARIIAHDLAGCLTHLDVAGDRLRLSGLLGRVGETVRVRIQARDIALALQAPTGTSLRNILSVQIQEILPAQSQGCVNVMLSWHDSVLWAQITQAAMIELQLSPGQHVFALIKTLTIAAEDIGVSL